MNEQVVVAAGESGMIDAKHRGRPRGSFSKITARTRFALAQFAELSVPQFIDWLELVATGVPRTNERGEVLRSADGAIDYHVLPDPKGALTAAASILEYCTPKLTRAEVNAAHAIIEPDVSKMSTAQLHARILQSLGITQPDIIDVEPVEPPEAALPPWMG